MALKYYTSVAKGLKFLKKEVVEVDSYSVEVAGKKLVGKAFPPSILNRVKNFQKSKKLFEYDVTYFAEAIICHHFL